MQGNQRHNDTIMMESILEISKSVARIDEKLKILEKHSKDISDIKKTINDFKFLNLMENPELVEENRKMSEMFNKDYHGESGYQLLPKVLDEFGHKIKIKKEIEKSFLKSTGKWCFDFLKRTIPIIITVFIFAVFLFFRMFN